MSTLTTLKLAIAILLLVAAMFPVACETVTVETVKPDVVTIQKAAEQGNAKARYNVVST